MEIIMGKLYGRFLMSCVNEPAFMDNKNAIVNIGDNIQSLALDYIYEKLGIKKKNILGIQRDYINKTKQDVNLVFHTEITSSNVINRMLLNNNININAIISLVLYDDLKTLEKNYKDIYSLMKKYEPIACRDEKTTKELRNNGIKAYLMGCFTICFPKREKEPIDGKVFLCDIPKELEEYIPENVKSGAEYVTHSVKLKKYPVDEEENNRIDSIAKKTIERYRDKAKLVVTGRLHAAVPCIAMGIPVILVCNNLDFRFGWIEKFVRPYQIGEYDQIDWNPVIPDISEAKNLIFKFLNEVIINKDLKMAEKYLLYLDKYYMDRKRVLPYKGFREMIGKIYNDKSKKFKYVIWGAGHHCKYAYELIQEIYPNAILIAVVDKYKSGKFKEVEIISEKDLSRLNFDHLFITTVAGTVDAEIWIKSNKSKIKYTFITSQHKS